MRVSYNMCLCVCVLSHLLHVHVGVAFTTSNVQKAVERVEKVWGGGQLAYWLCVPRSKRDEIQRKFSRLPQQKQALIKYWKDRNPRASWRSLIVTLDGMKENGMREKQVADDIRHLAEPLSGVYKCS